MDFGLHLPASTATVKAEELVRFAQQAEALGFYCLTVADHVIVPKEISVPYPYTVDGKYPGTGYHLETLMTMGFLAGATKRIRFVTSVMILPYRNPIVTAKMLASLDVLSGGRVIVGAGVGWMKEEFETIRTEPFEERGKVTDEYIAAYRELWTSDHPSFSGKYCSFSNIIFSAQTRAETRHSHLDRRPQQASDPPRRPSRRRLAPHRRRADDSARARGRCQGYVDAKGICRKGWARP